MMSVRAVGRKDQGDGYSLFRSIPFVRIGLIAMSICDGTDPRPLLMLVAGANGAVATTLAVATAALKQARETVLDSLTTGSKFPYLSAPENIQMAGWDINNRSLSGQMTVHGVIPDSISRPYAGALDQMAINAPPDGTLPLEVQIKQLMADIDEFRKPDPSAMPVFINLLPACDTTQMVGCKDFDALNQAVEPGVFPDLAYVLAAIRSGIPVINFTPNAVEIPIICKEAIEYGVPMAGRDGKTGQTYFKVALASALKARNLYVDGWYSLNILGNADGRNLMDPDRAAGKVTNKTRLLDEILGYPVGEQYGESAHKVHIDYYPPRGDAKEAWDVIDIKGLFGLPMSIRMDLQGRDSVLAAPMILDLARWVTVLHLAGYAGPVPDLGFFFKKPVGKNPPLSFQEQTASLVELERVCNQKIG